MKAARITRRCPFCYAPASEIRVIKYRIKNHAKLSVECIPCGARGPSSLAYRTRRSEVIFDWNRAATIRDWTGTAYQKARDEYARTHE